METTLVSTPVSDVRRAEGVRVALIRPPNLSASLSIQSLATPPIGLAYIASVLRAAGHRLTVVDAVGEALTTIGPTTDPRFFARGLPATEIAERIDPDTDVIGVACAFSHDWPEYRIVIDALRQRCPRALIVAGGEHMTAVPVESLRDCPALDIAVLGEGEETMAEVVAFHDAPSRLHQVAGIVFRPPEGGDPVQTRSRRRLHNLEEIPAPAWDLFPLRNYLDGGYGLGLDRGRSLPVLATRGCPYQCTFCSNPTMWTTRYETRSPQDVLAEIRDGIETYGIDNVDFYDLTMIIRRSWIVEFCQLILDSDLNFTWQLPSGTRSEAIDAEVCSLLYRAGCRNLTYAPESGSVAVLERIKKRVDLDRMAESMTAAVDTGISCTANTIIGFPGETRREILQTLRLVVRFAWIGLDTCTIAAFSPYPGSELFDELRASGRIRDLDDRYYLSLTFTDIALNNSYTDHAGARELQVYRLVGMILFYGISYARRPSRIVRMARGVFGGERPATRLEQALQEIWSRRRSRGRLPDRDGSDREASSAT